MRPLAVVLLFLASLDAYTPIRFRERPLPMTSMLTFQTAGTLIAGTGGSQSADTYNPWSGTQGVKLTAGSASTPIWTWAISSTNTCADSFFRVTVRLPNKTNTLNLNALTFYIGNNASNLLFYEFGSFDIRDTGLTYAGAWAQVHIPRRRFSTLGSPTCATTSLLGIGLKAQAAAQDTITMGEITRYSKRDSIGILLIQEDDQWLSFYQNGFPTLQSLGLKFNIFINGSRVGQANFMTDTQIRDVCGTGLARFSNHGWTHDSITDLSTDSAQVWMSRNSALIRGYGRSCDESSIFAYPFGKHSVAIDSLQRIWGLASFARLTKGNSYGESQAFNNPYGMRLAVALGSTVDTAVAKAIVDTLVAFRTVGIFLFHEICSGCTPADANTWRSDWFASLMNYVQTKVTAGTLQVMTTGEYFARYGGLRYGRATPRRLGYGK